MTQLPLFETPLWTVSTLTLYLRDLLESDEILQDLWVQGEVSNLSRPSSGHMYFTLKDSTSALKCVMWRNSVIRQPYLPRDGDAITVHGSLNIYEAAGQYQLYADLIRPAGEGALYQEFLRLKARLEAEGIFDPQRKRPIPVWPRIIGIVTSPTGAALRDILNTLSRRYPLVEVVLAPSPVQGDEAPSGIVSAIQSLNRLVHPDVILLARGGGSIEDLWAFNDERVARAIASSPAPIISGVGHETDFTIADFASDARAATPTAAAELATPDRAELRTTLQETIRSLVRSALQILTSEKSNLVHLQNILALRTPLSQVHSNRQRIDELTHRIDIEIKHTLELRRSRLEVLQEKLFSMNPLIVLQRGYAVVVKTNGQVVRSIKQIKKREPLNVRVTDGQFAVKVNDQTKGSHGNL